MPRLFVAVDLPADIKQELLLFCGGVPGARWVDDTQLHLTLKFIGDVQDDYLIEIIDELSSVMCVPLRLQLKGVGVFPSKGGPRVIWVGVEKDSGLIALQKSVHSALLRLGLLVERRKFMPHITIARLGNSPKSKVANFVVAHNLYASRNFEVQGFHLYSSLLTPNGAIHTLEVSFS